MMLARHLQTVSLSNFLHVQGSRKSSGRLSSMICGNRFLIVLMMGAVNTSETSTQRNIPENMSSSDSIIFTILFTIVR
jgi:hypothetical protein